VAEILMNNVGNGGKLVALRVSDELAAAEYFESHTVQKLALGNQAGDGLYPKA
jgi:hypothetical protein